MEESDCLLEVINVSCSFETILKGKAEVIEGPGSERISRRTKFQNLKKAWQSEVGSRDSGLGAMQGDGFSDASQGLFAIEPMDLYNFDILPSI